MSNIFFADEAFKIVGAAFEVYNELGSGFLENVYQEALEIEFRNCHIPFTAQQPLQIHYKGNLLNKIYQPDFICFNEIIIEIKAIDFLSGKEESQIINYLKASKKKLGLLINFGNKCKLESKRFAL